MIDVDSQNDQFANIGKSLASSSDGSILRETVTTKSIEKTIFLHLTDANEFKILFRNCETTDSSGLDGLSSNLLRIAGPKISEFLALIFIRCFQRGYFPNPQNCQIKATLHKRWHAKPQKLPPISLLLSLSQTVEKRLIESLESFWENCDVLKSKQNGFRKVGSTLNALIYLTDTIRAYNGKIEKTLNTFLDLR